MSILQDFLSPILPRIFLVFEEHWKIPLETHSAVSMQILSPESVTKPLCGADELTLLLKLVSIGSKTKALC